ncbi:hypothetical protein Sjap_003412 [Stephania japonica]|uniref:Uncharacterized protein n=1 Tax=Stephania japonica TaxID=461633 RepID=A0AAP0PTJ9_9MAGN
MDTISSRNEGGGEHGGIGRSPESWDNPDEFRPERFEDSEINFKGQHFEFLPFGGGRRIVWMNMGVFNAELGLANLLYCFNWELPSGTKVDIDEKIGFAIHKAGLAVHKKSPLLLVPVEYNGGMKVDIDEKIGFAIHKAGLAVHKKSPLLLVPVEYNGYSLFSCILILYNDHGAARECIKPSKVNGYDILPGMRVVVNAGGIGRSPEYWDNPDEFRPERFEDMFNAELGLANLLYCFNWELPSGTKVDIDEKIGFAIHKAGLAVHKKSPLLLVPVEYNG